MTDLVSNIKNLFLIYFTPYPYFLWCAYDRISNFGSTGVALGLMYTQVNFWICNGFIFFIWITQNNSFLYYFRLVLFVYTIYAYSECISKTFYLIRLLNREQEQEQEQEQ